MTSRTLRSLESCIGIFNAPLASPIMQKHTVWSMARPLDRHPLRHTPVPQT